MKSRLGKLLVISLAFNVFFMLAYFQLAYLQARTEPEKPRTLEERIRARVEKLDLDEQQLNVFEELLTAFMELREARIPQREAFFGELLKTDPDEKALEEFWVGEAAREDALAKLALMRRFIALLRPEQRQMFVEMTRSRDRSRQTGSPPSGK